MSIFKNVPSDALLINRSDQEQLLGSVSNHPFFLDDYQWPTAEHYYQALKFNHLDYQKKIREAPSPLQARKLGNRWFKRKRSDFKKVRTTLMVRAMYTKCKAHIDVRTALLDSADQPLAESSFSDYFWGCGRDGRGENQFGKVLMRVRAKLMEEQSADASSG